MKASLWLCGVLCWASCWCAIFAVPQNQKQWVSSSSLTPSIPPLDIFSDPPWLVSMPANCQGIVLSKWWILSTANCLQKTESSDLNISGVIDSKSIAHSRKICLHPSFDPEFENHPAKADIGVVLLEEPLYEADVPLSHAPNISLKSCSRCHYEVCQVYQYQSNTEFGTTEVKKLSVRLLDFSMCHHGHSHLTETEGLCIQSELQQDCLVQQASPVLCFLKSHWELVGLIHETSKICDDPTIVIRTTPYFTWIKQFIKASKNQLDLATSLRCRISHGSENVPQGRQGHNYLLNLASHRFFIQPLEGSLGTSSQTKHLKNSPTFLNYNGADSFYDSSKVFPVKSQIPQGTKFLGEQSWTTIAVVGSQEYPRDNSAQYQHSPSPHTGDPWNSLVAKTTTPSLAPTISDRGLSYDLSKAERAEHWDYPASDSAKSLDQIISPSRYYEDAPQGSNGTLTTRSWAQTTVTIAGHFSSVTDNTVQSWVQPITNTGGYWVQRTVYTASTPPRTFPSRDTVRLWKALSIGKPTSRIAESQDSLAVNTMEPLGAHVAESKWVPQPTAMIEPWSSSSEHYSGRTKDQSMTDSVRSHIHAVIDRGELQILPTANMGESLAPSKVATHASLEAPSGDKIVFSQGQPTTTPSQDQPTTAPSQAQSTTTVSQGQCAIMPSQNESTTTASEGQYVTIPSQGESSAFHGQYATVPSLDESPTTAFHGQYATIPSLGESTTTAFHGQYATIPSLGESTTTAFHVQYATIPSQGESSAFHGQYATVPSLDESPTTAFLGQYATIPSLGESTTTAFHGQYATIPSLGESTTTAFHDQYATIPSLGESTTTAFHGQYATIPSLGESTTTAFHGQYATIPSLGESTTTAFHGQYATIPSLGESSAFHGQYATVPSLDESPTTAFHGQYATIPSLDESTTTAFHGQYATIPSLGESTTTAFHGQYATIPSQGESSAFHGQYATVPSLDESPTTAFHSQYATIPSLGESTTTAFHGQYATVPSQGESTTTSSQGQYTTTPSKAKSSFGSVTQLGTGMELHRQPEAETV